MALIYLGALVLWLDFHKENVYRSAGKIGRGIFVGFYALGVCLFTVWLLWPASVRMSASSTIPKYGSGSSVGGIPWRDQYAEVQFWIENPSGVDLDNFDIVISTDLKIEDMRATGGLASCRVGPLVIPLTVTEQKQIGGRPVGPVVENPSDYIVLPFGPDGLPRGMANGTDRMFRIRCDKFPAHDKDTFIAAVTVVNPFVNDQPPQELYGLPRNPVWFTAKMRFTVAGRPRTATITECKMGVDCQS